MTLILASICLADKKVKKEFVSRINSDKTVLIGLKNSLLGCFTAEYENATYIIINEYKEKVGFISAEFINDDIYEGDKGFVYYYILPEYRCKGYCKNAIKEFAKLLYQKEGVNLLEFSISYDNEASVKCVRDIGAIEIDSSGGCYTFVYEFFSEDY